VSCAGAGFAGTRQRLQGQPNVSITATPFFLLQHCAALSMPDKIKPCHAHLHLFPTGRFCTTAQTDSASQGLAEQGIQGFVVQHCRLAVLLCRPFCRFYVRDTGCCNSDIGMHGLSQSLFQLPPSGGPLTHVKCRLPCSTPSPGPHVSHKCHMLPC